MYASSITSSSSSSYNSCYSLQVTIISAESITMVPGKKPLNKNLFVSIFPDENNNQIVAKGLHCHTKICQDNHQIYPAWHEKLVIHDVPMHVKFLVLEVRYATKTLSSSSSSSLSGVKSIGFAKVPVSDFVGNSSMPWDYLHFLSYRLRDQFGRPNGIINFSIQLLQVKGLNYDNRLNDNKGNYVGLEDKMMKVNGGLGEVNKVTKTWHVGRETTSLRVGGCGRDSSTFNGSLHAGVGVPWCNSYHVSCEVRN